MNRYSDRSASALATAHPSLAAILRGVLEHWDHRVLTGYRGEAAQRAALRARKSKLDWPRSSHNVYPSRAVDAEPCPVQYPDPIPDAAERDRMKTWARWYMWGGFVLGYAAARGVKLRWLGDSDGDFDVGDQSFDDLAHFELR